MGRLTNILVFIFLYLQCINSEQIFKHKILYAYKGKVLMKNVASDKLASIWTVSGILTVEDLDDHVTFKLDDVKTRIYNGDPESLNSAQEKVIPVDSKMIQEPFVVHTENSARYNITHKPDEPIWSLNMKRSIANIFILKPDIKTNSVVNETTIYGDCEVKYKVANNNGIIIWKIIARDTCENSPIYDSSNVEWDPTALDFKPIKSETKRIYHFDDVEGLKKVESLSTTSYQSMPGVRSKQIIEQSQEFTQISNTTTFDPLNIADLTKTSTIIFDYSVGAEGGRQTEVEKKNPDELIEYFTTNYIAFKKYFESYPLVNLNEDTNDTISYMYDALENMDKSTLIRLETDIIEKDDNLLQHLFISYLPYLGTNESLAYIKELIAQDEKLADLLTIKVLATLPGYIEDISQEIVHDMEGLMDLEQVANNQVKFAGILSFASIVSNANAKDVLTTKRLTKYVNMYYKKFEEAETYETKMVYLLGLINMANGLENNDIFEIFTNSHESRHIRVLALIGLKEHIISEAPPKMYEKIWPIVKNNTEPFEVRVACLDLLLYSRLTEDQFKNIVNWYKDELLEPSELHLANYMYTSLEALQNTTGYYEHLGDYATEALANMKPPKTNRAWSTGNYRMAYTDSDRNFGASFQAQLISNPTTNVLNSAILTVDNFAHSLNFGKYSAYIKAEGLADMLFSYFAVNTDESATVPKLLELVRKNAYRFKEIDDVHLDVVIFSKDRVVFSMHVNKHNVDTYANNPLFLELLSLLMDYNSVSFPVFDYNYLVSDLGTGMSISTDIVEVVSFELLGFNNIFNETETSPEDNDLIECDLNYRSISYYSLYTDSYNPLADVNIATYKYIGDEKRIHVPYGFNLTSMLLQWKHEKDGLNMIGDHLIGSYVDKDEVLHEYCENCEQLILINNDEFKTKILKSTLVLQVTGETFNLTTSIVSPEQIALDMMEPIRSKSLEYLIDHHQANTFESYAVPFLLFNHYVTYHRYIDNDLYRYSIRSLPVYPDSKTIFELSFSSDDNSNDEHPIAKDDLNVSIALTTKKMHDTAILSHGNFTFRVYSASETDSPDVQPHIHHKYDIEGVMYSDTVTKPFKICIDRDIQYPNRRTNKFSLDPIDSAIANTTFMFGYVDKVDSECPSDIHLYLKEIYSATDKQKQLMVASNEYKNCKEQSKGLKYIPPTDDCFAAHEMISKYELCDIYGDTIPPTNDSIPKTEHGIHLLRFIQLNETHSDVLLMNDQILERIMEEPSSANRIIEDTDTLPLMTLNPRVVAYDDDAIEWGFKSACYITPNRIRTFTGHTIKKYYEKSAEDTVALIECSNMTARGMTIQKYGDKHVGFHLYSFDDLLVASVPDGKLNIQFNNETVTKTNKIDSEKFKVFFLDDDVIYITSEVIEIFYTGEYISFSMLSITNNYICGLCTETQHY